MTLLMIARVLNLTYYKAWLSYYNIVVHLCYWLDMNVTFFYVYILSLAFVTIENVHEWLDFEEKRKKRKKITCMWGAFRVYCQRTWSSVFNESTLIPHIIPLLTLTLVCTCYGEFTIRACTMSYFLLRICLDYNLQQITNTNG